MVKSDDAKEVRDFLSRTDLTAEEEELAREVVRAAAAKCRSKWTDKCRAARMVGGHPERVDIKIIRPIGITIINREA